MCGIAGFVELSGGGWTVADLERQALAMADAVRHRGPDGSGAFAEPAAGLALGHRRLAVVDLGPTGAQPMTSASGRYVIVFNGEMYGYAELRAQLAAAGARYRGTSDTEVLLAAIEAHGLRGALERVAGMFAFALWDRQERALSLVRDRLGEKPLYFGVQARSGRAAFLFGSDLAALRAHPSFDGGIDRGALAAYLRLGYVPAPSCIHSGLAQLPPGSLLALDAARLAAGGAAVREAKPEAWWSLHDVARAGIERPFRGGEEEAADALGEALARAVAGQAIADVPLGAFLSGGIDSSTVVALLARGAAGRVRTFTMGFREADHDESAHARAVARHLGTSHEEMIVTPQEALDVIPRIPAIYTEPFADPSQVPTFLVASLARRHVTVALSGDGGDELFAGYDRHVWAANLERAAGWAPASVRRALGRAGLAIPERAWERAVRALGPLAPKAARRPGAGPRVHRLFELAAAASPREAYRGVVSVWQRPERLVPDAPEPDTPLSGAWDEPRWRHAVERACFLDTVLYLPSDILVKVDRAAMAVSLETRVPLLDHRVVALAWSFPPSLKYRRGVGKIVLRRVLGRHVPPAFFERPKAGFGVPIAEWLRGPLRAWAEDLLSETALRRLGLVEPGPVRAAWEEHVSGRRPHPYRLWAVLMLAAWHAAHAGAAEPVAASERGR